MPRRGCRVRAMTDLPGRSDRLPEQGVQRREPGVHLRTLNRVDDDIGSFRRAVTSLRGSPEPVIVVGAHQHEFAAAVPGDLHRLALRLMLELAELALEFEGTDCRHGRHLFDWDA